MRARVRVCAVGVRVRACVCVRVRQCVRARARACVCVCQCVYVYVAIRYACTLATHSVETENVQHKQKYAGNESSLKIPKRFILVRQGSQEGEKRENSEPLEGHIFM